MHSNLQTFLGSSFRLALINLLGLIALVPLPMLVFTDIWSYQNSGESDIVARGPFIAGMLFFPVLAIVSLLILIISFLYFRKQYFYEIFAGWLLSILLFVLVYFTPLSEIAYIPSKVLGMIHSWLVYIYFAALLFLYVRFMIKEKACRDEASDNI